MNYIAFDSHKRYTLASVERAKGGIPREVKGGTRAWSDPSVPFDLQAWFSWVAARLL